MAQTRINPQDTISGDPAVRFLALIAFAALAGAQTESFEDLAARAQSLLDSRPSEAATLLQQALKLRPDWAEGWMYCGAALYQSDGFAEATDAFRKGVALAPGKGTAWAFLGLAEAELDNADQALADIRKGEELGITANPQFETAVRVKAAQLLVKGSSFDEAMAQLVPLAKRGENSPPVEEAMGLCSLAVPQSPAELTPERRAVVDLAGKAAWDLASQRPADAVAAYQELLAKYGAEPGVHYAYGLYLMETDLVAALAEFKTEVAKNPKHWPALIVMGSTETRQGDGDAATQALRQAMKIMPVKYRWIGHAELGRAELTAGNVDQAIAELESALRQASGNPQVHFFLAQAYRRAGRKADAQRETAEFEKLKAQQDPLGVPGLLRSLQ
jgi:cytochrome c-type biogenesis protein CcmH/NrfG